MPHKISTQPDKMQALVFFSWREDCFQIVFSCSTRIAYAHFLFLCRKKGPPLRAGHRASTKSMLCHRKSASSLSMGTSICYKMAFPGSSAWKCSFYGRKLIEEAAFSRSSDRQSRSCGLLMKGLRPFHAFLGFVDSLEGGGPKAAPLYLCCFGKITGPAFRSFR